MMYNLNKISRQQLLAAAGLAAVFAVFALAGHYHVQGELNQAVEQDRQQSPQTDSRFTLPVYPPARPAAKPADAAASISKASQDAAADELDMVQARVWEVVAKQPLPPRKEALTPARWRIVGTTTVADEKNVLVLFENQPVPEIRKTGEKLPGGAKIIEIAQDHLKISLNGQIMNLSLRKQ